MKLTLLSNFLSETIYKFENQNTFTAPKGKIKHNNYNNKKNPYIIIDTLNIFISLVNYLKIFDMCIYFI